MCPKRHLIFLIISLSVITLITGNRIETIKRCCTFGSEQANSKLPCSFSSAIKDVDSKYEALCLNSMGSCCKSKQKEIQCSAGQEDAKLSKPCTDVEDGPRRECCNACTIGLEAKTSGDDCDIELGLDETFNRIMSACCKEVTTTSTTPLTTSKATTTLSTTSKPTTPRPNSTDITDSAKKTTPYKTTLKNMCGISDTCAQLCIPEGNSFRCDCRRGYTLMKDGVSCKPARLSSKTNRCKPNPCAQKCVDTGTAVECSCHEGFELNDDGRNCDDIDECEIGTYICQRNETCINYPGGYECYDPDKPLIDDLEDKLDNCPEGYSFNADLQLCDDIDECEVGLVCPRPQSCVNTIGSYECTGSKTLKCPPGFYFTDETGTCEDIDECSLETDDCNRKSQNCINTKGNFTCIDKASKINCPPGFKMDTKSDECVDIDECEENKEICGKDEKCINEPGRYACVPTAKSTTEVTTTTKKTTATEKTTTTAKPTTKKLPDINPTIDNEISSYVPPISKPTVNPSYKTSKPTKPTSVSSFDNSKTNINCAKGFKLISNKCVDVDECVVEDICDSNQDCYNTVGSYVCRCKIGFTKDYHTGACVDVNECAIGTHDCSEGQRCDNSIGSFICSRTAGCGTGYTLNYQKGVCEDDDECELHTDNCNDLGPEFVCRNTLGSYRCERIRPQTLKPTTSQQPDVTNLYNFINGQLKRCLPGYRRNAQGDCEDIDECESSPCPRGMKCLNAKGKFHCISGIQCMRGMELNETGEGCVDIDECARGVHKCKTGQICENHVGFHVCKCPSGHRMNSKFECEDVDECQMFKGRLCYTNAYCRNTIGSYSCECKEGFYKNGQNCEDIDECSIDDQLCDQTCVNIWGSYRCSCSQGYTLNSDNRTCSDINECEKFKDKYLCVGSCENVPGSYLCRCPPGYKLGSDGRTCQDIDECQLSGCADNSDICVNTRGGHRCKRIVCPPNYIRDPEFKSQCKKAPNACDPRNISCNQMPDHYSYFFVSFGSNLLITKPIEFLHLRTPDQIAAHTFHTLRLVDKQCPPHVNCVTESHFKLIRTQSGANLAIVRSIEGPQDIELELETRLSLIGYIQSIKITKIFMFVSQYSF